MNIASHLKNTTFAVAALLAGGAGLMMSMDGRASDAVPASLACAADKGWDMACLRQTYAAPLASWPRPQVAEGVTPQEMAPVSAMPLPSVAPQVAVLGQRLFNDPRLSRSNAVACISCHSPAHSFADSKRTSTGQWSRS